MTLTDTRPLGPVPTFPFSMFDPVHLGVDENGEHVYVNLAERNMLLGGEPGGGKSSGLNLITAHGALSYDCKLILVDGKQVELGPWRTAPTPFIGPSIRRSTEAFEDFQGTMNDRYKTSSRRRPPQDHPRFRRAHLPRRHRRVRLLLRHRRQQEPNGRSSPPLARDLVARGRAAGVIVILATQRPSHQVIDPSMRDLFGYRWAFRCTTDSTSDVVLGHGWAVEGYTAASIDPLARGVAWLLSETGVPRRIKTAYLTDHRHSRTSAAYAADLRGRAPHDPHARRQRPQPPIAPGPHCGQNTVKTRIDTQTRPASTSRTTSTPRSPAASCAPTPAASRPATSTPSPTSTDLPPRVDTASARPSPACATSRLLLGRDRAAPRHHPPGRPATLGQHPA